MIDNEKMMSEEATGCYQQGEIVFYNEGGDKITNEEATKLFENNEIVEVPNAGAGSFREIISLLGFSELEVIDWTSSAGDWAFGVKNEIGWFVVWQENRYPYYGFKYCLSDYIPACSTFEELCNEMELF